MYWSATVAGVRPEARLYTALVQGSAGGTTGMGLDAPPCGGAGGGGAAVPGGAGGGEGGAGGVGGVGGEGGGRKADWKHCGYWAYMASTCSAMYWGTRSGALPHLASGVGVEGGGG